MKGYACMVFMVFNMVIEEERVFYSPSRPLGDQACARTTRAPAPTVLNMIPTYMVLYGIIWNAGIIWLHTDIIGITHGTNIYGII